MKTYYYRQGKRVKTKYPFFANCWTTFRFDTKRTPINWAYEKEKEYDDHSAPIGCPYPLNSDMNITKRWGSHKVKVKDGEISVTISYSTLLPYYQIIIAKNFDDGGFGVGMRKKCDTFKEAEQEATKILKEAKL